MTIRGDTLREAIRLTEGNRQQAYGDPAITLSCMGLLKTIYRTFSRDKYSLAHDEAVEAALIKIARIATGSFHPDNYVDGAGYIAIAAECEQMAKQSETKANTAIVAEDYLESRKKGKKTSKKKAVTYKPKIGCSPFAARSKNGGK